MMDARIFILSAMTLPIVGAGFLWGPWGALELSCLSSLAGFILFVSGRADGWFAGPWMVFGLVPVLLWSKGRQLRLKALEVEANQQVLFKQLNQLRKEQERQLSVIKGREESIQRISELYGLSKQFLATLDMKQAIQLTDEAIAKWLPQVQEEERAHSLKKIQSLVQTGAVSIEALIDSMPSSEMDSATRERLGIVSGQLALGLKRVSLYRQVQESAIHDGLTGLLVRRTLRERLEEEVARALRRSMWLTFLIVDLDHFKQVNDTYGHLVGDVVLREVAQLIRRSVREVDLVGRYGGEEFGVVLPEAGLDLGIQIADRIRQTVEKTPLTAYDERISITVSIGVASCPKDARDADQLIEQADQAMYQAKALGRNKTVAIQ